MHHLPGIMSLSNTSTHSRSRGTRFDVERSLSLRADFFGLCRSLCFPRLHEIVVNMHEHVLEHVLDGMS